MILKRSQFLKHASRIIAILLCLIYSANVVLADYSQATFWEDRRRSSDPIQLAGLLPALSQPSSVSSATPLKLQKISDSRYQMAGISESLKFIGKIPSNFGTIRKIIKPQGASDRVLIHIQDVHLNQEAQGN